MHVVLVGAELEENLAIRSLAATLLQSGHRVGIVRFDGPSDMDPAAQAVVRCGAGLVGLSMVFTHRAREFAALAERVRELGCTAHITAGGHFASFNAEALLGAVPALDSVVIGEGERILLGVAQALDDPRSSIAEVRGLVFRSQSGIARTAQADKPSDLDELPAPLHRHPFQTYLGMPIANMLSSRGCAHACSFCSIAAWHRLCGGERYRIRSVAAVADEMADLYLQGVRIFNFHDDHFLLERESDSVARIEALRAALDARGVGRIAVAIKARPDRLSDAVLNALSTLGLFRVFVGIEAGTEESLRQLGRGQRLSDNERALELLRKRELHAAFNLLLFNPNSTLDDVVANVRFLQQHADFPSNFCRTEVYAGTPLESRLLKQGRLRGDFWGWNYRMADPWSQALFEALSVAFEHRNFTFDGLHHMAMRLDYERALLAHFWRRSSGVHERVKELIQAINLDTASHLLWAAERIRALGPDSSAAVARDLKERVARTDAFLSARAQAELENLRASVPRANAGRNLGRTVAVGMAATLALAASQGCGGEETHYSEMAAPWAGGAGGGGGYAGHGTASGGGQAGSGEKAGATGQSAMGGTHASEMVPRPVGAGGGGSNTAGSRNAGGTHVLEMAPRPIDAGAGGRDGGPRDAGPKDGDGERNAGGTHIFEMAPRPVDSGAGGNADSGSKDGSPNTGGTHASEMAPRPVDGPTGER